MGHHCISIGQGVGQPFGVFGSAFARGRNFLGPPVLVNTTVILLVQHTGNNLIVLVEKLIIIQGDLEATKLRIRNNECTIHQV